MVQVGKLQGQAGGIGALQTGAADHDVGPVLRRIGADAVPQQFDGALVAVGRQHTGTADFQEAQSAVALEQRADIVLADAVKTAVLRRHLLAQQPIGANHRGTARAVASGVVDHQEMVADRIEGIDIAPHQ